MSTEVLRYRKKPVVIEAMRFLDNGPEIVRWSGGVIQMRFSETVLYIPTLEGIMEAFPCDYIIKGIAGEYYPCKPSIFHQSYELVSETQG